MVWYFLLLYLVFWSAMKDIGGYEIGYHEDLRNVLGVKWSQFGVLRGGKPRDSLLMSLTRP
jgi:hypothetical protein